MRCQLGWYQGVRCSRELVLNPVINFRVGAAAVGDEVSWPLDTSLGPRSEVGLTRSANTTAPLQGQSLT